MAAVREVVFPAQKTGSRSPIIGMALSAELLDGGASVGAAEPLNVIVVADSASMTGGMQKCAIYGALGMAARGHKVTYLAGYGPVDPLLKDVNVICFEYPDVSAREDKKAALRRVIGNRETANAMRRLLSGKSPSNTIVHVHDVDRIVTTSVMAVARRMGFPVVMTLHTYGLACPSGSFFDFREERVCDRVPMSSACRKAECTGHGKLTKLGHIAKFAVNRTVARVPQGLKHIICVSDFSRDVHLPHLPVEAEVRVVLNHVDAEQGPRVDIAANESFVFVGRLVPEKGPDLLAAAAKEAGVRVKFVGDGPSREKILEINPLAEITGWVPPAQVHEELRNARALCMVSRWYEGLPLVVGEALAKGVPVISSDSCAGRDSVVHGETGLIFRSGEIGDLAEKLKALLDDERADSYGRAAYDRFWANPQTLEKHVGEVEQVYREALGARALVASGEMLHSRAAEAPC
jgi:glycosyltransferase involved in cell wall biosynthesis